MARFGEWGTGDIGDRDIAGHIRGGVFTCSKNGVGISITAKLEVKAAACKVKCALYDSDYVFIAETEEINVPIQIPTWTTFTFTIKPNLVAGRTYVLCAWAAFTIALVTIRVDFMDAGTSIDQPEAYDGWPAALDPNVAVDLNYIYCTYDAVIEEGKGRGLVRRAGGAMFR